MIIAILRNGCCMLVAACYLIGLVWFIVPQMDTNSTLGACVWLIGVGVGLYGIVVPIWCIVDGYIKEWERQRKHYNAVKNAFALHNEHYWNPDWNLKDLQSILNDAKQLGIDKELQTERDCRIYLYGYDNEENRPPRQKFNSNHTMIYVDGRWHDIPDKFYGKLMDEYTVDQIVNEVKKK